jgi:starch synthase
MSGPGSPLRVAIATVGRFHVLDLARELSALGHHVAFWSVLPRSRAVRFGLPPDAYRSLLPMLLPFVAAHRYGGRGLDRFTNPLLKSMVDRSIARRLEPCDVFIGMSGLTIESARAARQRYGAKVFIERGSRHILSQKAILDEVTRISPNAQTVSDDAVDREQATYDAADVVVVPSRHAMRSFVDQSFPTARLFRNPYGVDLDMFEPTAIPTSGSAKVLFVGTWSYQKGCDVLTEAIASFRGTVDLLHVGTVGDAPLPQNDWFRHFDPVPQWQLREHYARAHVFVIASREEGLALVQAQALACGLPVVCTDRTGGEDLKELLGLSDGIFVVPSDDAGALAAAIEHALVWSRDRFQAGATRDLLGASRERLSWRAYGQRYSARIGTAVAEQR